MLMALASIAASIQAPFATAFRSSVSASPPVVAPLDFPTEAMKPLPQILADESTIPTAVPTIVVEKAAATTTTPRRKVKYDLGLGKNKPVTNTRAQTDSLVEKDVDPTQFLIQHESTRPYPSPLDSKSVSQESKTDQGTKRKRKNLPRVQHRRHSEDVLSIRDSHDDKHSSRHPVIAPIHHLSAGKSGPTAKLDVNTIWVEMMLHNEQKKVLAQ